MKETLKQPSPQETQLKSKDVKAAAREARLKAALRSNLRRRKNAGSNKELESD